MSRNIRCPKVRKLILSMSESEDERHVRLISDHLSECEACRSLEAASQKLDRFLVGERRRLDKMAPQGGMGKSQVFAEMTGLMPRKRTRGLRAAWAGAAALLLVAIAGASILFLKIGRNTGWVTPGIPAPRVTQAIAAAASSQTVQELAEVAHRHEVPSFELPYTPPASTPESFFPRLLQQSALQSEETLSMILQSRTNLTRRNDT